MATISFQLNGKSVVFNSDEVRELLWVLRTDLALTGLNMIAARVYGVLQSVLQSKYIVLRRIPDHDICRLRFKSTFEIERWDYVEKVKMLVAGGNNIHNGQPDDHSFD